MIPVFVGINRITNRNNNRGAVALRKMIQDIVGINHSSILYLVYVLLSATASFSVDGKGRHSRKTAWNRRCREHGLPVQKEGR